MLVLIYRGHLVIPEDVVVHLQSFCSDRSIDPFKRIAVLRTFEQVSWYIHRHWCHSFITHTL